MPSRHLARLLIGTIVLIFGIGATALAIKHRLVVGVQEDGRILVPNGQTLTPIGTHIEVNDRPLGMDAAMAAGGRGWRRFRFKRSGTRCRPFWKFSSRCCASTRAAVNRPSLAPVRSTIAPAVFDSTAHASSIRERPRPVSASTNRPLPCPAHARLSCSRKVAKLSSRPTSVGRSR